MTIKRLLFATSNLGKINEIRNLLPEYEILGLKDIGFEEEIPEPFNSISENAAFKANYFFEKTKLSCLAEDSGLMVEILEGAPGVHSARYAGEEKNDIKNIAKLLENMKSFDNRNAKFVSVMVYFDGENTFETSGEMLGNITRQPKGLHGFGYDPIFQAIGQSKTNAELTIAEKNNISHRKKALVNMMSYLKELL